MSAIQLHTFENGLRLAHLRAPSLAAHFAVVFGVGSRDELPAEHGVAHCVEHMLFKGTTRRKPYHIACRMEDVGGEIDAYTSKEYIVLSSSFPKAYFGRAAELLADLTFNPTFPDRELAKEREVIAEEIKMYRDTPAESIFDHFDELRHPGHPFGRNILGTQQSLRRFTGEGLGRYWRRHLCPAGAVVCTAGDMDIETAARQVERHFGFEGCAGAPPKREAPTSAEPFDTVVKRRTHQAHCVIGLPAPGIDTPHRLNLKILANLLGGPGMNTRLNTELREKRGLVYQVDADYTAYSDCGSFAIYFGCDAENLSKCKDLALGELERLAQEKLGVTQLRNVKRQLEGQVVMDSENLSGLSVSAGKSLLALGEVLTTHELLERLRAVTSDDLLDAAQLLMAAQRPSVLSFV